MIRRIHRLLFVLAFVAGWLLRPWLVKALFCAACMVLWGVASGLVLAGVMGVG